VGTPDLAGDVVELIRTCVLDGARYGFRKHLVPAPFQAAVQGARIPVPVVPWCHGLTLIVELEITGSALLFPAATFQSLDVDSIGARCFFLTVHVSPARRAWYQYRRSIINPGLMVHRLSQTI
jgi:hypothetical protein